MRAFSLLLSLPILLSGISLFAFPHYLESLQADPMLKPAFPTHCGTCHVNPDGGGKRNRFGEFFEEQKTTITPLLRARDGVKFIYPIVRISDTITIHFSDPMNKQFVIESADRKFVVVDIEARKTTP